VRVYLIASKVTDSVVYGFLPAARRLGLELTVLTDQPEAHERAIAAARGAGRPGAIGAPADLGQPAVAGCDPWDLRSLIPRLAGLPPADAIVSNSDHLQTQTALAADYFGLPGKDWRAALRARDKVLMRRRLAQTGTEHVAAAEVTPAAARPELSYPVVLKPATGVASEDVVLVHDRHELARQADEIARRRHALTEAVVAGRPGVLAAAPPAGPQPGPHPGDGTALTYWPLRHPGDHISLTHTNRDYLGVICALGPDPAAVERAVRDLRTSGPWEITAEIAP
jgi:biotin carboxylase